MYVWDIKVWYSTCKANCLLWYEKLAIYSWEDIKSLEEDSLF